MSKKKRKIRKADDRGFTLPVLHKCKRWYVSFSARDPETGFLKRKKCYIYDGMPERMKNARASFLIAKFTQLLEEGWSPWVENGLNSGINGYTSIERCLDEYLKMIKIKSRKKTYDSYCSRVNILRLFLAEHPIQLVCEFDSRFCACFLEWLQCSRNTCPRTVNNYRGWMHGLGEFFVNHKYIIRNPIKNINILPEHEKIRKDLTPEMLQKLSKHLQETDIHFYLACLMEYYTMIRPSELVNLTIADISIAEQSIYIDGRYSKNHKTDTVGLNDAIMRLMTILGTFDNPSCYYIFSNDFKPGPEKCSDDAFNKKWKKVREALGWPRCYQFYSLKDSGIRDLANAEGVVVARDQARHSDVAVTNKYIQQHEAHECTKHFKGALV